LANHKSAIKRIRQNEKRSARNKTKRSQTKHVVKDVLLAVEEKNTDEAQNFLKKASTIIAKNASKGLMHKRAASRKISGLAKKVYQLSASA
jgi:small subunit ribosomal protein S20